MLNQKICKYNDVEMIYEFEEKEMSKELYLLIHSF